MMIFPANQAIISPWATGDELAGRVNEHACEVACQLRAGLPPSGVIAHSVFLLAARGFGGSARWVEMTAV